MPIGSASLASYPIGGEQFIAKQWMVALALPFFAPSDLIYYEYMDAVSYPLSAYFSYTPTAHTIGNHIIGAGAKDIYPTEISVHSTVAPLLSIATNQFASPTAYTAASLPLSLTSTLLESNITELSAITTAWDISATLVENVTFANLDSTALPLNISSTAVVPTVTFHREYLSAYGSHVIGHGAEQDLLIPLYSYVTPYCNESNLIVYGRLTKVFNYRGRDSNNNFVFWQSYYSPDLNPKFTDPQFVGKITEKVLLGTDIVSC